jgi:hypothetical protein
MPKPDDHHRKLEALSGHWRGAEKIHPTPWDSVGGEAEADAVANMALDGFCLIMDYTQRRGGKISYLGHGVFGWDRKAGKYTMYWFDTVGGAPIMAPCEGTWEGNTLSFLNKGEMGWGRYTYRFDGAAKYRFSIEMSQDQKAWTPFIEGEFTRI